MKLRAFWYCVIYGHSFIARGQLHSRGDDGESVPSIWAWYCDHCYAQYGSTIDIPLEALPRRSGWRIWFRTIGLPLKWKLQDVGRFAKAFFYKGYDVLPLLRGTAFCHCGLCRNWTDAVLTKGVVDDDGRVHRLTHCEGRTT